MTAIANRIPAGPAEAYFSSDDLLTWMVSHFAQYGDIYSASIGGSTAYVVGDPKYADHILRENWQNYRKGDSIKRIGFLLGKGLMVSEGDLWKRQRRMIQPAFHGDVVRQFSRVLVDTNSRLVQKWLHAARTNAQINVTRDVSSLVLEVTLRYIFGDDYEEVAPHFNILSSEPVRDLRFMQLFRPLGNVVSKLMSARRMRPAGSRDALDMLMSAHDRETGLPMPDPQIVSETMTLIVAGHETTASTLGWVWYLLSEHPKVEEKLARELCGVEIDKVSFEDLPKFRYTRQVIEEAMRLYPPGWLMIRKALKDDHLGEYFVPAGTEVYIAPYLIQRNPRLWNQPEEFDPDREEMQQPSDRHESASIPFSAGPRKCIGELLARVEMQFHVMAVASELRLRLVAGDATKLEAGVNLRCKDEFIMLPEIRGGGCSKAHGDGGWRTVQS
jgi:cytochrome P450